MTDPETARILVIEDEPRIAEFLLKGLAQDGYEVIVAEDGEIGLFLALSERFDAVVLDIGLPGRSGLDVLLRIRRRDPVLPVIMLTGHDDPSVHRACSAAGVSGFIRKPLRFGDLSRMVAGAIRAHARAAA
jgi:DNA-binding response OmpR family regulator